jgi:hypothetical protein
MPATLTVMEVGAQPLLSVYRTLNLIAVVVVPEPGLAWPELRAGSWALPAQEAA